MSDPVPSGTVVVLRDAPLLEVLLLQRIPRDGHSGPWVFPGGKVEDPDRKVGAAAEAAARRAASREAWEEAALSLAPDALVPISRWITPPVSPRRFDTWFFAAGVAPSAEVRVDGEEIGAYRWLEPRDALRAHQAQEIPLAPPTFVTVSWLAEFAKSSEALRVLPRRVPPPIHPRIHRTEGGACILYPGDAGYECGDLELRGARHRLWTSATSWRYERRGVE